jgi:HEAT repeat protein
MVNDENSDVRKECAVAISKIGDKGAASQMVKALDDSNSDVQKAVKNALVKLKWRPTTLAEKQLFNKVKW